MKIRTLAIKIADLLLVADVGSQDWINVVELRKCWYAFIGLILFGFVCVVIIETTPLHGFWLVSESATLIFRISALIQSLCFAALMMLFTYFYYRHSIERNNKIYFENITFFYLFTTAAFFMCYNCYHSLFPESLLIS